MRKCNIYWHVRAKYKDQTVCKTCRGITKLSTGAKDWLSAYRSTPEFKEKSRAKQRIRKYGSDIKISGLCVICLLKPATCIDHNHTTNKVRGFVCHTCNRHVAALDEPGWLEKGLKYLEVYN